MSANGTNLFGDYYNNPTKSYVYSGMTCNGASADEISFDITKQDGVISDNENTLSTISLGDIHVPLTQYTRDMKTINPYSFIYVKGVDMGDSYTTKAYGLVTDRALEIPNWEYITTAIVHIKYLNEMGHKVLKCIVASGSDDDEISFVESMQEMLDEAKIPVSVEYKDRLLYFTATVPGYEFWITDVELWHYLGDGRMEDDFPDMFTTPEGEPNDLGFGFDDGWSASSTGAAGDQIIDTANAYTTPMGETQYRDIYNILGANQIQDSSTEIHNIYDVSTNILFNSYMFEDLTKYVPARKYRNGAMKGCVVVATYPQYKADGIQDVQRSLKIAHLKDRIEEFYTSIQNSYLGLPMYVRVVRDVVDSYYSQYEYDIYNKWSNAYTALNLNDGWIDPEEIPYLPQNLRTEESPWAHSHVPNYYMLNTVYKDAAKYDAVGLYGYANYLSKHNLWESMGQLYARTTVGDDESTGIKNLIPSFLIYNPNSFPVIVNYMTFA